MSTKRFPLSLRKLRAVGVVSALFGVSTAMIVVTINFGMWILSPPPIPRSQTFLYIFATIPTALLFGSVVGVAFSVLVAARRARSDAALRMRRIIGAGLLSGAAVGFVGTFYPSVPRDLHHLAEKALQNVGVLALIGASSAAFMIWIAQRSRSTQTYAAIDGMTKDSIAVRGASWSHARSASDFERDHRSAR